MDVSNINETLLKGIQRAQLEQAQLLSKVLGIKINEPFLAQVEQLAKASPEERAQLTEQIAKSLSQLNPNSTAPATKALINQLLAQQAMVQSGDLKLVTLNTQGINQQPQSLLTYTDLLLEQGQPLLLKLDINQRLVILGTLAKLGLNYAQFQAFTTIELEQYLKPLLNRQGTIAQNTYTAPGNISPVTLKNPALQISGQQQQTNTLDALRNSIINLLPRKDLGQDLLTNMQWITQQVQKMPLQERNQWFTSELQQALKTLANHLRSPQELTNPKLLASALRNSGVYFEQKLTGLIPADQQNTPDATKATGTIIKPEVMTNMVGLNKNALPPKDPLLNTDKSLNTSKNPDQLIKQDLKGALLSVLHNIEQELEPLAPLLTGKSPTASLLQATQPQLAQLFAQLMGMPSANIQNKELSQKNLRAQLMMLLQQHTLGSLAKIQLQQFHALNHKLDQADSAQPTQSWQFEIPLRHGQETHHLHLQLEYQWVDEETTKEKETPNKTKQWQIMLGFNMDSIGQFYVQLTLLGNSLSANFWAERISTLEKTRSKLDELQQQLEREGINIKSMQCLVGLPTKPKMSLGYSLVDIQT